MPGDPGQSRWSFDESAIGHRFDLGHRDRAALVSVDFVEVCRDPRHACLRFVRRELTVMICIRRGEVLGDLFVARGVGNSGARQGKQTSHGKKSRALQEKKSRCHDVSLVQPGLK